MPEIYKYKGIIFKFYSNEHYPIHIHAICDGQIMKIILIMENEKITKVIYEPVTDTFEKEKELKAFVNAFKYNLVDAWVKYFVYHKHIKPITITRKL